MGSPAPQQAYQAQAAMTATPAGLVLMLYDGALAAIAKSTAALGGSEPDLEVAHTELTRAQDIMSELQVSLDHEVGGDLSRSLAGLYSFCIEQLIAANVGKDPSRLPPVARIIGQLRNAFAAAEESLTR